MLNKSINKYNFMRSKKKAKEVRTFFSYRSKHHTIQTRSKNKLIHHYSFQIAPVSLMCNVKQLRGNGELKFSSNLFRNIQFHYSLSLYNNAPHLLPNSLVISHIQCEIRLSVATVYSQAIR